MKRLLLASVTLLALTGMDAARAGDMPPAVIYPAGASPSVIYPATPPSGVVYPAASPPFTFTGFYAGGTVGGALGSSKYSEAPSGTFVSVVPGTSTTPPPGRWCRPRVQILPPSERVRPRREGSSAASKSGTIGKSVTSCWASRPISAAGICRAARGWWVPDIQGFRNHSHRTLCKTNPKVRTQSARRSRERRLPPPRQSILTGCSRRVRAWAMPTAISCFT